MTVRIEAEGFNYDACLQALDAMRYGAQLADVEIKFTKDFQSGKLTGGCTVRLLDKPGEFLTLNEFATFDEVLAFLRRLFAALPRT